MSILLAATWLLLDAARSSVAHRARPRRGPAAPPPIAHAPRRFVNPGVGEWARAAEREAVDALLATRPGTVRRVAAR